jgi:hypothetical protein
MPIYFQNYYRFLCPFSILSVASLSGMSVHSNLKLKGEYDFRGFPNEEKSEDLSSPL